MNGMRWRWWFRAPGKDGRLVGWRSLIILVTIVAGGALARPCWAADEVDKAFAAGNEAASKRHWKRAVTHYERARKLSPGRSASLSYNLGTAYAHLGQLGYATVHLNHALAQGADSDLAERARQNLGLLRRQAEMQAAASGRVLSDPAHWSSLVVAFLGTSAVGWCSIGLWWLAALLVIRRVLRGPSKSWVLPLGCAAAALVLALLYLYAASEQRSGKYIVVGDRVALREGPGEHRSVLFEVQPASQLRLLGKSSGWAQVRLPGARQGWMLHRALAPLRPGMAAIPVGTPSETSDSGDASP